MQYALFVILLLVSIKTLANTTQVQAIEADFAEAQAVAFYGINSEEWARYQKLKRIAAIEMADAHPLMVLAYYAKTEAETQRYIEAYARHENARLKRLFDLNERFYLAQLKLTKGQPIINLKKLERIQKKINAITGSNHPVKRTNQSNLSRNLIYVKKLICKETCKNTLQRAAQLKKPIELFFAPDLDATKIAQWASKHIPQGDFHLKRAVLSDPYWLDKEPFKIYQE